MSYLLTGRTLVSAAIHSLRRPQHSLRKWLDRRNKAEQVARRSGLLEAKKAERAAARKAARRAERQRRKAPREDMLWFGRARREEKQRRADERRLEKLRQAEARRAEKMQRAAEKRARNEAHLAAFAQRLAEVGGLPQREIPPRPQSIRQIGILCDMGIGNLIMFQPAVRAIRRRFPDAEIVQLNFRERGNAAHAIVGMYMDRMLRLSEEKWLDDAHLEALRDTCSAEAFRPDLIVARWTADVRLLKLFAAVRPPYRAGIISSAGFEGQFDAAFNIAISMEREQHEVERYMDVAAALGCPTDDTTIALPIGDHQRATAEAFFATNGIHSPERAVCLQTGSSALQPWKRWPLERWMDLVAALRARQIPVVLLGAKEEEAEIGEALTQAGLAGDPGAINAAGALSLLESAALLEQSRLLVAADSSLMHIAAALGTDLIVLMGPTDYERTRPWTDRAVVLQQPCRCNTGTLFDNVTVKRIEACTAPCMLEFDSREVISQVLSRLTPSETIPHTVGMVARTGAAIS